YEIAESAIEEGAAFLGVANAEEGAILRYRGIKLPILILSPSMIDEIPLIQEYQLTPTISDFHFATALNESSQQRIAVHINIDTGMGRSGFSLTREWEKEYKLLREMPNIYIEGIFSHFAASENDSDFTSLQKERFRHILSDSQPKYVHISNSSAVVTCDTDIGNLVRLGLLSFGIYSDISLKSRINLKPVMTFKTRISMLKSADAGESIGYNRTFEVKKPLQYAILPIGYADGYDFLLGNKGKVSITGQLCPVIGKISMDMIAVDVSGVSDLKIGEEVIVIGGENENLRAENITAAYEGSSYELLCQIGRRAKRYYFKNNKLIASAPQSRRTFFSGDFSDKSLNQIIEAAISQRLQSREIASLIYDRMLRSFFQEKDSDVCYRTNFRHEITFSECDLNNFYLTETSLLYNKVLQSDYFLVVCANTPQMLEKYFARKDVEYRWLLSHEIELDPRFFKLTEVSINGIQLASTVRIEDGSVEIRCSHPDLTSLIGEEVAFSISSRTYYPKNGHQMSVFITEPTQGVAVTFKYPANLSNVEAIPVFAGRSRFPAISRKENEISVSSDKDEWVFPNSGIVFAY
ncbi:MAG: alanine racemase, partial [Candidatus Cloacimonetes bacterium]|nr:alanine racemase [Candidatus Cloacimonadota bacterium]